VWGYKFRLTSNEESVKLPFITDEGVIGFAVIQKNTFPAGTVLSISAPKQQPTNKDSNTGCSQSSSSREPVDRASPVVDIKADNAPNSNFDPPVKLQLGIDSGISGVDSSSVCLGYSNNNDPLQCNSEDPRVTDVVQQQDSRYDIRNQTVVHGRTTHFTTFAVLLFGSSSIVDFDHCDRGWLWPLSIALLGSCLLTVPAVVFTVNNTRLKRWFYGYHSRTMKEIETQLVRQQTNLKIIEL